MPKPEAQLTVVVVDDEGRLVPGADVGLGMTEQGPRGITDVNGTFTAHGRPEYGDCAYNAEKNGYYPSVGRYSFTAPNNGEWKSVGGRWIPYEHTVTSILKRIKSPVPMHAKRLKIGLPVMDQRLGYDLLIGDWETPVGKGVTNDLIFHGHLDKRSEDDWVFTLTATFRNHGDGIQHMVDASQGQSRLRSHHEAPLSGYQSVWILENKRRPHVGTEEKINIDPNYYIRIRTITNATGEVVSAMYGKVYGKFLDVQYFVNPTGSRNVEFDPNRNLINDLDSTEEVRVP